MSKKEGRCCQYLNACLGLLEERKIKIEREGDELFWLKNVFIGFCLEARLSPLEKKNCAFLASMTKRLFGSLVSIFKIKKKRREKESGIGLAW